MKLNGALQTLRDEAREAWKHFSHHGWHGVTRQMALDRTMADLIKWGRKHGFDEGNVRVVMDELVADIESERKRSEKLAPAASENEESPQQSPPQHERQRARPSVDRTDHVPPREAWRQRVMSPDGPPSLARRAVLMALSVHLRLDGTGAYPSLRRIAECCHASVNTVVTHLRIAEREGWIRRVPRYHEDGSRASYGYEIAMACAAGGVSAPETRASAGETPRVAARRKGGLK